MITSTHEIALEPVTSKALGAIGYDPEALTLAVQFPSGHIFHYRDVPEKVWTALQAVPSKGSYYAREIKKQFKGEKVTGTCAKCGDVGMRGATCTDCGTSTYTVLVLAE